MIVWSENLVRIIERSFGVTEAKAKLCELLDRAAAGEEITITRSGKPHARIVPPVKPAKRKFGMMKGKWPAELADLDWGPMSEEDIRWAEGYYQRDNGLYYTKRDLAGLRKEALYHPPRKSRKAGTRGK